ncbi:HGxxPAAW family protein [Georgenia alba]|uniref:HGxxPAAW family protein n=1 Tax=Georgenia alba TaxID=2233858 RepID=A0ABW2QCM9_9MICO
MAQIPQPETYTLPPTAPFDNHGRTKAAWVLVFGVSLGVLVGGLGMILARQELMIAGAAVTVLSLVVSAVMRAVGLGQADARKARQTGDWYSS